MCPEVKISLITATWNPIRMGRLAALQRCVESVAAIRLSHEHIVIDGGSEDGTVEKLREWKRRGLIDGVCEPDTGIYNALNKGWRRAKGRWVHILGCDDYICDPESLVYVIEEADRVQAAMAIAPTRCSNGFKMPNMKTCLYSIPYCHQGLLVRRDVFDRIGGFDESFKLAADYAFTLKAHLTNLKYVILNRPFAFYSLGGASGQWEKTKDEVSFVAAKQFGLAEMEREHFRNHRLLPLRILLPLLLHPCSAVRKSSLFSIVRHFVPEKIVKIRNQR